MPRTNIEAERGRMQMTKGQMCEALGVTLKTYNGYINGLVSLIHYLINNVLKGVHAGITYF